MKVDVEDGLARSRARVHHDAMARCQLVLPRQLGGDQMEVPQERLVGGFRLSCGREMFARYDQKMHGGLRMEIAKGDAGVVFIDDLSGSLVLHDLAEDAGRVCHGNWRQSASERILVVETNHEPGYAF